MSAWLWVAAVTALLGSGGMTLLAEGVQNKDWRGFGIGGVCLMLALAGIGVSQKISI